MNRKYLTVKVLAATLIVVMILGLSAVVHGSNTAADPLVTLSYITGTYQSKVMSEVNGAIAAKQKTVTTELTGQINSMKDSLQKPQTELVSNDYQTITLTPGKTVAIQAGSEVLFLSGGATVDTAVLTDTTAGSGLSAGGALAVNHLYLASGSGVITATSEAKLLVK